MLYTEDATITEKLEFVVSIMKSEAESAQRHMGWREEDGQEAIFAHFYDYAQDKGYSDAMEKAIRLVQTILDEEYDNERD